MTDIVIVLVLAIVLTVIIVACMAFAFVYGVRVGKEKTQTILIDTKKAEKKPEGKEYKSGKALLD